MIPITVIPWDRDFLSGLARYLAERFGGRFENVVVLFPHRRPRRYLFDRLAAEPRLGKPCLLPEIVSIGELFDKLCLSTHPDPLGRLGRLDQVGMLHRVVTGLGAGLRGRTDGFPEEIKDFFPWGLRLASLMDEFFQQNVTATDLNHLQGEVMSTAATLLANLRAIQHHYRQAMLDRKAVTPGLAAQLAIRDPEAFMAALAGKQVLACGFNALTGCEETLLHTLWRAGQAEILWHTDPAVATPGQQAHWSCAQHRKWLADWKAKAALHTDEKRSPLPVWRRRSDQLSLFSDDARTEPAKRGQVRFFQGFDLHTQLKALSEQLEGVASLESTAVVLTDTSMLMSVLHHLPRRDVNVSMGFPLSRSPLFQFVELLFALQDGRMPAGCHWRDLVSCLRHPLLKFLEVEGTHPLRQIFHAWEQALRVGERFVDPLAWRPGEDVVAQLNHPEAALALLDRVREVCFSAFETTGTPESMAKALTGLAGLLLDPALNPGRWERFVIDAQCLARLLDVVIPELADSSISRESFEPTAIRAMARELVAAQRAPFEADPLSGLQVLGMLETRLLTFERVFVLGATEELLPGAPSPDPLLPDPLREPLGLPDRRGRDFIAAHTFYRLIQGAREVGLFYSTGVTPGLFDGKSQPSRYVEQLLWEEEKRQGHLLSPTDEPRHLITLPRQSLTRSTGAVRNTPACRQKLDTILRDSGLSATFLDNYAGCPLRFFYTHLTPLRPLKEVAEDGDPPEFGKLVHVLLQDFFTPHLNQPLDPSLLDANRLCDELSLRLHQADFFRQMPASSRILLERAGRRRLSAFVRSVKPTTILRLETQMRTSLETTVGSVKLRGDVDRVDRREDGLIVLDYKTGTPKKPQESFFSDEWLWDWIRSPDPDRIEEMLPPLSRAMGSVQLPLYLWLNSRTQDEGAVDAAFVCLGEDGREELLFGPKVDPEARARFVDQDVPALVRCLLDLILNAPSFIPLPSRACAWCAYAQSCPDAQED